MLINPVGTKIEHTYSVFRSKKEFLLSRAYYFLRGDFGGFGRSNWPILCKS